MNDCNIDDIGLVALGKGIRRNKILTQLDVDSNPYTGQGALEFLKCFTSKETSLRLLQLNQEVHADLQSKREYHRIIQQIKSPLIINPPKEESLDRKLDENIDTSIALSKLPPQFNQRESNSLDSILLQEESIVQIKPPAQVCVAPSSTI